VLRRARSIWFVAAVVGLSVGACTSAAAPSGSAGPSLGPAASPGSSGPAGSPGAADPNALVLRVSYEGGLVAPDSRRTQLPAVSVYADGRIMTAGAVPAIYPGPLLATLVYRSVGPDGAANILAAAEAAGLTGKDATYPSGPVEDLPSTVITVVHDGTKTVTTFGTLGGPGGPSLAPGDSAGQVEVAAAALVGRLMGNDTFGGTAGPEGTYQPLGFQVFVIPGAPESGTPGLARPPVAWPLATPLASFGRPDPTSTAGGRVGLVTGSEAATLGPILAEATQLTGFTSGGAEWTVAARALLPDEVTSPGG
jgi:hypothetical protein